MIAAEQILQMMMEIDPQTKRLPSGIKRVAEAVYRMAIEDAAHIAEIEGCHICSSLGQEIRKLGEVS